MKNAPTKNDALQSQLQELKMVCEIWIAANNAKDARIQQLEAEVERLQQRVARLSRRVSRSAQVERAPRVKQAR